MGDSAAEKARKAAPAIGLGMLLKDANGRFNRALRDELAKEQITFSQFQHLHQLWKEDGIAQVELSRRIGIETASSTAVIDQLEKLGFIERQRHPKDKRRLIVHLTPVGRSLERRLNGKAAAVNVRARKGLTSDEVETLFQLLQRIVINFA